MPKGIGYGRRRLSRKTRGRGGRSRRAMRSRGRRSRRGAKRMRTYTMARGGIRL